MRYKIELVLSEEVSDIASPSTTPSTSVERPLVSDFEKSPLRFEFEAAMEEYRSLRVQIVQHLSDQQQITSFAVGLIAAMVALSQFLPANVRIDLVVGNPSLLVLSLPFSALTLGYLWHDVSMIWIGRYIDGRLRPRIEAIQTQATEQTRSLLAWETFPFF